MIEKYSELMTDFMDGTSYTATSETVVCDRCGFSYSKTKLTKSEGLDLCSKCIDKRRDDD